MANEPDALAEPSTSIDDPGELLAGFLDCYRDALLRKVAGLGEEDLRASRLPSGWSPLSLVKHLTYVERRWLRWGFAAEEFDDPWGDSDPDRPDGPWLVTDSETSVEIMAAYRAEIQRCREVVTAAGISQRASAGGRFDADQPIPTLGWILCHLIQEYARHVGQLDVVRELIDGVVGE
jgi:uncharacterized damage-inducible protein DinB